MDKITVKHLLARNFQTAESMKTLRTNLQFSGESVKVVALTSYGAAEGKSTISFQLAASCAFTATVPHKNSTARTAILPKSLILKFVFPIRIRLLWFYNYCISMSRMLL